MSITLVLNDDDEAAAVSVALVSLIHSTDPGDEPWRSDAVRVALRLNDLRDQPETPQFSAWCQIAEHGPRQGRCNERESGGYYCEREPHPDEPTKHWISHHTAAHAVAGNGFLCSAIHVPVGT